MCDTATMQARIRQKKSVPGALEATPEVEIWRRSVFMTLRPQISICPKVGQSTQLLPVLQIHQVWQRRLFTRVFRITVNCTTFRTISGTFESTSGFWTVLPGYRFRFGAPVFLLKAFLAVHVRYGDNAGQNKAKKERPGGSTGLTGSRNMAAIRFSDSATPTSYLSESRPKYTT